MPALKKWRGHSQLTKASEFQKPVFFKPSNSAHLFAGVHWRVDKRGEEAPHNAGDGLRRKGTQGLRRGGDKGCLGGEMLRLNYLIFLFPASMLWIRRVVGSGPPMLNEWEVVDCYNKYQVKKECIGAFARAHNESRYDRNKLGIFASSLDEEEEMKVACYAPNSLCALLVRALTCFSIATNFLCASA